MSEPGLRAIALDFGTSSLRRVRRAGADVRPVPDLIRGSVRTPAALAERAIREGTPRGAALAALGRAALADAVSSFGDSDGPAAFACVVAATTPDEEREAIRAAAVSSGFTAAEVISAPIALALAREEETKDRALWLVVDAGHAALRAHLVRWHTVSGRSFPRVEKTLREAPEPGGLALDAALAKAAWTPVSVGASASEPRAALPPAEELSSRGFYEVKELAQRVRGPLARRIALAQGSVDIEVPAADSRAALVCFMEKASAAASEIARLGKEAGATRAVAGGGLLELAPFRAALEKAIPGLVSLEAPLFAASRGALRSLEASPVPRTAASLRLVARSGPGVVAREVVPAGASLPGRFGPVSLEVSAPQDPLELSVLEGEVLKTATFPRRPPRTTFQVDIEWTYEHAWRVLPRDQTPPAPLVAQSEERAKPLRDALSFDFSSHAEAAPVDALFLFVATQGEGPLLGVAADGILALAKRLAERAKAARVGAIAIGDHPQGAVRPRYATLAHPFGDAAALEKFVRDQQKSPVDGIDAPEALECGLAKAAESAWRADAEKAVFVITDVPPHEKGEPPFCNVDWREGAKKLRSQGATVVSVFLEGGALAPDIAKRTRAFLEEIRSPSEPVVGLRGKPGDALLAAVDRLAAQKRLSGAAQSVLARVAVGLTGA